MFRQALAVVGPSRLLFGTDSSFFPRGWRRVIVGAQRAILDELGIETEAQAKIFGGNFERLFSRSERLIRSYEASGSLVPASGAWMPGDSTTTSRNPARPHNSAILRRRAMSESPESSESDTGANKDALLWSLFGRRSKIRPNFWVPIRYFGGLSSA